MVKHRNDTAPCQKRALVPACAILLALPTTAVAKDDSEYCQPGPAVAEAIALVEQGRVSQGCEALLAAVQAGSQDPWAYRGAVTCAVDANQGAHVARALEAALAAHDSKLQALVAFARGLHAGFNGNYEVAEQSLRLALARAPSLALIRAALATAMSERGEAKVAISLLSDALQQCPDLEPAWQPLTQAQGNAARVGINDAAWERVWRRLDELPGRWDKLPAPLLTPSQPYPYTVVHTANKEAARSARMLISQLALAGPSTRSRILAEIHAGRGLNEVDLWYPMLFYMGLVNSDAEDTTYTVERLRAMAFHFQRPNFKLALLEAWLELAEQAGRRDVLFYAAGIILRLDVQSPADSLLSILEKWNALPTVPHGLTGAALLAQELGESLLLEGYNQKALTAYRRAKELYQQAQDAANECGAWKGEGDALFRLGRNPEALSAYRHARALARREHNTGVEADGLMGEADVLFRIGQNQAAIRTYRDARALFEQTNSLRGQGYSWESEADVLAFLGQKQAAIDAHRHARKLFLRDDDILGAGNSLIGEAGAHLDLAQYHAALRLYRVARDLFEDAGDDLGLGNSWLGEAKVKLHLDQHEAALRAYQRAQQSYQQAGDMVGEGNALMGEANVLAVTGQLQAALDISHRGRDLYQQAGDVLGEGNTWLREADILADMGDEKAALHAYRRARKAFHRVGAKLNEGATWKAEAMLLGRHPEARRAARRAVRLAREGQGVPNELNALVVEASRLVALHQDSAALRMLEKQILPLFRQWRSQGVADLDRTVLADMSDPYDLLITILSRIPGKTGEAFDAAEAAHGPVLHDLLLAGVRRPAGTQVSSLLEERRRIQDELAALDRELMRTVSSERRSRLKHERRILDEELELNDLMELGSLDSPFIVGEPIHRKQRQQFVANVGPILLYYVTRDQTIVFLHHPSGRIEMRRLDLSWGYLAHEVRALRHDLANSQFESKVMARQRNLYEALVAPFAGMLGHAPRVTIIPHGPLHELPFEALLIDYDTPLFERWHVSIAPSLSALHTVRERRGKRKPVPDDISFLGIAGGIGLSLSGPAVEDVGTGFGAAAHIFSPGSGSHPAYLKHAPRARHLLVATHGTHVAQSRSGHLELTAAAGHPTRLTASEIAQNPLRAELVTLAACETARGEAMYSDERLDLTRAFLIAGADAVLATRWKVPATEETRLFLVDFYQALRQGGPGGTALRKDEALTEARRRSRRRGDDAQLWAAWVLVGDAR
jgi:CHAT domain-containing protein/tetratricopeptide (TPR) repeat protein